MRIQVVSPFPPENSGVSYYANSLADAIQEAVPSAVVTKFAANKVVARGAELSQDDLKKSFDLASTRLYQMGNSSFHGVIYDLLKVNENSKVVTTVHDVIMDGFYNWKKKHYGDDFDENSISKWLVGSAPRSPSASVLANIALLSDHVVVHSKAAYDYVVATLVPELVSKFCIIPMGMNVQFKTDETKATARSFLSSLYQIDEDKKWVCCMGLMHPTKCNDMAYRALSSIDRDDLALIFVGEHMSTRALQWAIKKEGSQSKLGQCVWSNIGIVNEDVYEAFLHAADIGLSLRMPPTNMETSAACMDLLRTGNPVAVHSVGSFAELPNLFVTHIEYDKDGYDKVAAAVESILDMSDLQVSARTTSQRNWCNDRSWSNTAEQYLNLIT